jgi:cytochrome c peroxidase
MPAAVSLLLMALVSQPAATAPRASANTTTPAPTAAVAYDWHLPRGFPTPAVPADNPMSDAKVALGRRLFFEPRLSVNGHYSCASCHDPARSFSDGRALAVGATGQTLPRNAMALVNVAYNLSFGWTRREVASLEAQMREPMLNQHPVELGLSGRERSLCTQLAADPSYASAFAVAFSAALPGERPPTGGTAGTVTFAHMVKAIAAFERTLISGRSPFDRYVFDGEHAALSPQAKRGMELFFSVRVGCARCHSGFNFAGNWRDTQGATGPAGFANDGTSRGPMRVPTLRNIELTAPYMHDGRFATLEEVLEHYSRIGELRHAGAFARYDPRLPRSALSATERAELIAFLDSLTDRSFVARFAAAPGVPKNPL